jgi:hypothetical protein
MKLKKQEAYEEICVQNACENDPTEPKQYGHIKLDEGGEKWKKN